MNNLVENVTNKNFIRAKSIFTEKMLVAFSMLNEEKKKMIAATLTEEEDNKVTSLAGEREKRELSKYHKAFMGKVSDRAQEMKELIQKHVEAGKFPFKVGDRFSTEHGRKNQHAPFEVVGYHVDPKNPEENYGYHVRRDTPDGEERSMIMIKSKNLEKLHGPEKWAELQAGMKKETPRSSGDLDKGNVVDLGQRKLVNTIRRAISSLATGEHQDMMNSKAHEFHKKGYLPLKVGTDVVPPEGWDMERKWKIDGYWSDVYSKKYGYKLKNDSGEIYHVHNVRPHGSPYVFGSGFRAYTGPSNSPLTYSDDAVKSFQASIKGSTNKRTPEEEEHLKKEYDNLFGTTEQLSEARVRIIKARIRNGKVQRRKKVSNVSGYTLRSGKLTRMSPAERRRRKLGAKRGKIKRRAKMTRTLMKRQRSLRRRKSMGL